MAPSLSILPHMIRVKSFDDVLIDRVVDYSKPLPPWSGSEVGMHSAARRIRFTFFPTQYPLGPGPPSSCHCSSGEAAEQDGVVLLSGCYYP